MNTKLFLVVGLCLLYSVLPYSVFAGSCFDENTSVETSEIGHQLVDVTACSVIETKNKLGDLLVLVYFGLFVLAFFCVSILLVVVVGWIS